MISFLISSIFLFFYDYCSLNLEYIIFKLQTLNNNNIICSLIFFLEFWFLVEWALSLARFSNKNRKYIINLLVKQNKKKRTQAKKEIKV